MTFSKETRDCKIRCDHKYKEARQAFQISSRTYSEKSFHPSWQNFKASVKKHPKCILSNSYLLKLSHLENKKNYYFNDAVQLEYLDGKFKGKAMKKGKNKGKAHKYVSTNQNHLKWCNKKNCSEEDISLVYSFKDNSPVKPDDSLPKCQICFYNNSGFGKKYFKECQHGSMMCSCCAKAVWRCPFCRRER